MRLASVAGRLVARPIGAAHVHSAGDRPGGLGGGGPPRRDWRPGSKGASSARVPARPPPFRDEARVSGIGVVDLGHPPGRRARGGRIVARQVRVVGPRETPPGRLDLRRRRADSHAEHVPWVSFDHRSECRALGKRSRQLATSPWHLTASSGCRPLRRWGSFVELGSRRLSPRRSSGSPIGSPSPTGCVPATRVGTRRGSRRSTWAWRSRRLPFRRTGSSCRPGSFRLEMVPEARASSSSTAGNRRAIGRCRWPFFLHAAGFHCLTFDVRGHGANPPEALPLSAGEFGLDAAAAFRVLLERPEVTVGAISGHSMGAIGAILAAAADPRVAALVATSSPADPYRLTRQTFRLAQLPIPDPIAYPLAWLTTRVYLRPRGHDVRSISASAAIARYRGPILLAHGDDDAVVPSSHLTRLARAARASREGDPGRGTGRDPAHRGRPAFVALRGPDLSPSGRSIPDRGLRRAAGSRDRRRDRGGHDRRAHPRWRDAVRGDRGDSRGPANARPGRAPGRDRRGRAGTRTTVRRRRGVRPPWRAEPVSAADGDAVLGRDRHEASSPRVQPPSHWRRNIFDRILRAGRRAGSSKNLQRWTFIVCRDRAHLRELSELGPVGRASRRSGRRDRPGDAGSAGAGRATLDPVRSRTGGREHDAGGLGARDRERARRRSTSTSWPADRWATRPTSTASTCSRSATRPIPARSPARRYPAAAATSTRSSARSAGSRPAGRHRAGLARGAPWSWPNGPWRFPSPPPYCQRNLRDAIPKQTTSQAASTRKQVHRGANAAPPTITWRSASAR